MSRNLTLAALAALTCLLQPVPEASAQSRPQIETFFRNGLFHVRNNTNKRVMCQVSAMVSRGSGIGPQTGLEHYQRAIVLFPGSEETPFTGPVGNPRVFDCQSK
jgi:hypothetical protein